MSLKHILLGLLEEPLSGYEIKTRFDHRFSYFWSAELAQIYPALDRLESQGLASSEQLPSAKGPSRRVYVRSEEGCRELEDWLAGGPQVGKERIHYLAQVYYLKHLSKGQRIQYFQKLRDHFGSQLGSLRTVESQWSIEEEGYPDRLEEGEQCIQFTLRLGLKRLEAGIEWCDECLAVLRGKDPEP